MQESTTRLIESVQQGKLKSFLDIYKHYFQKVYEFLFILHDCNAKIATTLTNRCFLKALDMIHEAPKDDEEAILLRLLQIAYALDNQADEKNQERAFIDRKYLDFRAFLEPFNKLQKAIILLRLHKQYSYEIIANIIEKSEQEIKSVFLNTLKAITVVDAQ